MLAPARGFYMSKHLGKDEVRIAYVLNRDDLEKAVEILREGLESYRSLRGLPVPSDHDLDDPSLQRLSAAE